MITLHNFQQEMVQSTREKLRAGIRRILLQAPTGAGKTVLTAFMTGNAAKKGKVIWFVVHRRELIRQSSKTFQLVEIPHGIVSAGWEMNYRAAVQICGVQTLVKRLYRLPEPDMIIWDECFPSGTLIDGIPIEQLQVGDSISSFNHTDNTVENKSILATMKRDYHGAWVKIKTSSKQEIICTGNHPIFVAGRGYISAINLQLDDAVIILPSYEMPSLRKRNAEEKGSPCPSGLCLQILQSQMQWIGNKIKNCFQKITKNELPSLQERNNKSTTKASLGILPSRMGVLFTGMQHGLQKTNIVNNNEKNKSQRSGYFISENASSQSDLYARNSRENNRSHERKNIYFQGWQRPAYEATINTPQFIWIAHGICNIYSSSIWSIREFTNKLQSRFSRFFYSTCNRSRWANASYKKMEVSGSKKNKSTKCTRLENIEIYKPGNRQRPLWMPKENIVYNIHVEKNENYFANGILVHNCHHTAAKSWSTIYKNFPQAIHIGLTATPRRLDGKGLGDYFDTLICGPDTGSLIRDGYLTPYRLFSVPGVQTEGLHHRGGDFKREEVVAALERSTVMGDAVAHYLKHANGRRGLVFEASIERSERLAKSFRDAGIPAAHVDGNTDAMVRDMAMRDLETGALRILCNVDLFGEGVDVPAIEVVHLCRPTDSLTVYLQQVGRGLRLAPGKHDVLIFDHAGNVSRHGRPDDPREWVLTGTHVADRKSESGFPVRQCPNCYAVNQAGAAKCCECGKEFPIESRKIEQIEGELTEDMVAAERRQARREQGQAQSLESLIELGRLRGYRNPSAWARYVWQAREAKHGRKVA